MDKPMMFGEVLIGLRVVIPHNGNPNTKAEHWRISIAYMKLSTGKKWVFSNELRKDLSEAQEQDDGS